MSSPSPPLKSFLKQTDADSDTVEQVDDTPVVVMSSTQGEPDRENDHPTPNKQRNRILSVITWEQYQELVQYLKNEIGNTEYLGKRKLSLLQKRADIISLDSMDPRVLVWSKEDGSPLLICEEETYELGVNAHKMLGHANTHKIRRVLSRTAFWYGMIPTLSAVSNACVTCIKLKDNRISLPLAPINYERDELGVQVLFDDDAMDNNEGVGRRNRRLVLDYGTIDANKMMVFDREVSQLCDNIEPSSDGHNHKTEGEDSYEGFGVPPVGSSTPLTENPESEEDVSSDTDHCVEDHVEEEDKDEDDMEVDPSKEGKQHSVGRKSSRSLNFQNTPPRLRAISGNSPNLSMAGSRSTRNSKDADFGIGDDLSVFNGFPDGDESRTSASSYNRKSSSGNRSRKRIIDDDPMPDAFAARENVQYDGSGNKSEENDVSYSPIVSTQKKQLRKPPPRRRMTAVIEKSENDNKGIIDDDPMPKIVAENVHHDGSGNKSEENDVSYSPIVSTQKKQLRKPPPRRRTTGVIKRSGNDNKRSPPPSPSSSNTSPAIKRGRFSSTNPPFDYNLDFYTPEPFSVKTVDTRNNKNASSENSQWTTQPLSLLQPVKQSNVLWEDTKPIVSSSLPAVSPLSVVSRPSTTISPPVSSPGSLPTLVYVVTVPDGEIVCPPGYVPHTTNKITINKKFTTDGGCTMTLNALMVKANVHEDIIRSCGMERERVNERWREQQRSGRIIDDDPMPDAFAARENVQYDGSGNKSEENDVSYSPIVSTQKKQLRKPPPRRRMTAVIEKSENDNKGIIDDDPMPKIVAENVHHDGSGNKSEENDVSYSPIVSTQKKQLRKPPPRRRTTGVIKRSGNDNKRSPPPSPSSSNTSPAIKRGRFSSTNPPFDYNLDFYTPEPFSVKTVDTRNNKNASSENSQWTTQPLSLLQPVKQSNVLWEDTKPIVSSSLPAVSPLSVVSRPSTTISPPVSSPGSLPTLVYVVTVPDGEIVCPPGYVPHTTNKITINKKFTTDGGCTMTLNALMVKANVHEDIIRSCGMERERVNERWREQQRSGRAVIFPAVGVIPVPIGYEVVTYETSEKYEEEELEIQITVTLRQRVSEI